MSSFTQEDISLLKAFLNDPETTDEVIYEIFGDVFSVVKERMIKVRRRVTTKYTNKSPMGIADELNKGTNDFSS